MCTLNLVLTKYLRLWKKRIYKRIKNNYLYKSYNGTAILFFEFKLKHTTNGQIQYTPHQSEK